MSDELVKQFLVKTINLEIKRMGFNLCVSPEVLIEPSLREGVGKMLADTYTIGLRSDFPYHELMSYMKPVNWWEAVKERFAPRWLKRKWSGKWKKWSVKYDKVDVGQIAHVALPKNLGTTFSIVVNDKCLPSYLYGHKQRLGYCMHCREPMLYMAEGDRWLD